MALGLRLDVGARRDAEEPVLGVDRVEAAVGAELHPRDVVADALGLPARDRRDEHREVRLAARRRERGGDVVDAALRRRELEDQHVLGEPALVARDHRRDAQREALLAEERVAAVARAVRPDLARLGEVHDPLLVGVARPRGRRPRRGSSGAPSECTHGTNSPSSPSTSSAPCPARVIMRMLTATYGESVISTPMYESGEPSGPMLNGTTYIVRPRIEPRNSPCELRAHLGRVHPVVRGAGVGLALGADEGAVLDPGDVARVGGGPVGARRLRRGRARRRCRPRRAACRAARAPRRSRRTSGRRRARRDRPSPGPRRAAGCASWAFSCDQGHSRECTDGLRSRLNRRLPLELRP